MNDRLKSIINLTGVQVFRLFAPIITLPIISSSVSKSAFAEYLLFQAISLWVFQIIEYGFSTSASKIIKNENITLKYCLLSVTKTRLMLSFVFFILAVIFTPIIFNDYSFVIILGVLNGIAIALAPIFYYQHKRQLGIYSYIEFSYGGLSIICAMLLVDSDFSLLLYIALLVVFRCFGSIYILISALSENGYRIKEITTGRVLYKEGKNIFLSQFSASLYTTFNHILTSVLLSPIHYISFSLADKVSRGMFGLSGSVTRVLLRDSIDAANDQFTLYRRVVRLLIMYLTVASVIVTLLCFLSGWIFTFLTSGKFEISPIYLQMSAVIIPIMCISSVIGYQFLIPIGYERLMLRVITLAAVVNCVLIVVFAINFGALGAIGATIIVESMVSIIFLYNFIKLGKKNNE